MFGGCARGRAERLNLDEHIKNAQHSLLRILWY